MFPCDFCGKNILGTSADPVCYTSLGRHHYACMHEAAAQAARAQQEKASGRRRKVDDAAVAVREEKQQQKILKKIVKENAHYMRVGTYRLGNHEDLAFDGKVIRGKKTFEIKHKGSGDFEITRVA